MELPTYQGWPNQPTWAVHLHLANSQELYNTIEQLIAEVPDNDTRAGQLLSGWVTGNLLAWSYMPGLTTPNSLPRMSEQEARLLAWDLITWAVALTEWQNLTDYLTGRSDLRSPNPVTMVLVDLLSTSSEATTMLVQQMERCVYHCEQDDILRDWVAGLVDVWVERRAVREQMTSPIAQCCERLMHLALSEVQWQQVARAFRPEREELP